MAKILVLFAHPLLEKSRVHSKLAAAAKKVKDVTFHDLYEEYPDFDIDINEEKELLLSNDIIVLQHPFYWYSAPPIIKQWLDLVLEYGWAYGRGGIALTGKFALQVISAGGKKELYSPEGRNQYTFRQFLAPFEQSFRLCHMQYLSPYVIYGTHRLGITEIDEVAAGYGRLLSALQQGQIQPEQLAGEDYIDGVKGLIALNKELHEQ